MRVTASEGRDIEQEIADVVRALVSAPWPTSKPASLAFLQRHGFVPSDGSTDAGESSTPFPGVTGHWRMTEGTLDIISLFPCETIPTDRDRLLKAFELLSAPLSRYFGEPETDAGASGAPMRRWRVSGWTISAACHWHESRIGVVQLAVERGASPRLA